MAKRDVIINVIGATILAVVIVVVCLILSLTKAEAQITPVMYYQFNSGTPLVSSVGAGTITPGTVPYTINTTGGQVGAYITKDISSPSQSMTAGNVTATNAITIQYLIRPGRNFQKLQSSTPVSAGSTSVSFIYPYVVVTTSVGASTQYYIALDKVGKASWSTLMDGGWHMITFVFNSTTGLRKLYIDGQSPSVFDVTDLTKTGTIYNGQPTIYLATTVNYTQYAGDLDEIAIYNGALTANQIWKNWTDVQGGAHYTTALAATVPPYDPITAGYDPTEYTPGYPTPTYTVIQQLLKFPKPRYKPIQTAADSLLNMLSFADPIYLGGQGQPYSTGGTYDALNGCEIYMQLAKDYNFALNMWGMATGDYAADTSVLQGKMIKRANANPQYKLQMVTFFTDAPRYGYLPSNYGNQSYPAASYLQNSSGQFYNSYYQNYNQSATPFVKVARPSISASQSLSNFPDDSLKPGYTWHHNAAIKVNAALTRPLDYSVENGEVYQRYLETTMNTDPVVAANLSASGYTYIKFQSLWRQRNELRYRDTIVGHLANMVNTKYNIYQLQGNTDYFHEWAEMRVLATQHRNMRLSSSDLYVRQPIEWYHGNYGAFHGFRWFMDNDSSERANGDNLNSPFVSGGWGYNQYTNLTFAQYLGIMKIMVARGGETFYSSVFPGTDPGPIPDPRNYIANIVAPSYAQATGSRFERYLHAGYLMQGDIPNWPTRPSAMAAWQFNTGDFRTYCVVRKDSSLNKYVISATHQRNNNIIGNTEDTVVRYITLNSENLTFTVRQQGSVYIYDNSNPLNKVFYQIDKFHEKTHPYNWTGDFNFEAEVNDNYVVPQLKTTLAPTMPANNYVNSTTYISYADTTATLDTIRFNFEPRTATTYYFWIRLKSRTGAPTGVSVKLNNGTTYTIPCITSTSWYWYRYDGCVVNPANIINWATTAVPQHLGVFPTNKYIEIDQIVLTSNASTVYPENTNPCVLTATITPGGATTFCQGGSVSLTANVSTSYLWSTGATTQAITASTAGSYIVTITDGTGCTAVSASTTVTVNSLPSTPTITPSGSTTICSGSSVTLTSTVATSYLWSTGAVTSSISASAAATYTVTVTNASGCTRSSASVTVTVNAVPGIPTITPTGSTTFCQGGSVILTSSAGTTYLWSNSATTAAITTNLAATYTVTVTNASGCTRSSAGTTVTVNPNPVLGSIAPQVNTCPAVTFDLSTIVLVNTGEPGASSYHPTQGDAIANTNPIAAVVAATGVYWIRVTTGAGCYDYKGVTVTINSCLCVTPPSADAGGDQSICNGLTATMAGVIGGSATTGTWTSSGTGAFTPSATTLNAVYTPSAADTVLGAVTLTLTTDNPAGAPCVVATDQMILTLNPHPTVAITPSGTSNICSGSSVILTASVNTTYLWSTGATTQSISVSANGTYYCTVTNAAGCTNVSAGKGVIVNANPATPTITPGGSTVLCSGGSVSLTSSIATSYLWSTGATTQGITASASGSYIVTVTNAAGCTAVSASTDVTIGATPPTPTISPAGAINLCSGSTVTLTSSSATTYLWSTGATTQAISVGSSGTYRVTVTNATGCTASSAVSTVSVVSAPTATITPSGPTVLCSGGSVTLTATANTSYLWSTGATTQAIVVATSGTYQVTVTNVLGCSTVSGALAVSISSAISPTITPSGPTTFCSGGSVTLSGPGGYTYTWSTGATTQSIIASTTGTYTLTVTNPSGCTGTTPSVAVSVTTGPNIPVITPSSPISICTGQNVQLVSTPATTYLWSTGATTQDIITGTPGNYTVTVTNAGSCTRSSATTVVQSGTSLTPTITASGATTFCQGGSVVLTSSSATLYAWSTGATTQAITVSVSGTYTVTVTDAFGCTKSAAPKVVVVSAIPAVPTITPSGSLTFCNNGAVGLRAPDGYASYLWSNGSVSQGIVVKNSNTFTVTVTNSAGCTRSSASVTTVKNVGCTTTCGIVSGVTVGNIQPKQATVSWAQINVNQSYRVFVKKKVAGSNTRKAEYPEDVRNAVIFDLKPGTTYQTWIKGVCNGVVQTASDTVTFTTTR